MDLLLIKPANLKRWSWNVGDGHTLILLCSYHHAERESWCLEEIRRTLNTGDVWNHQIMWPVVFSRNQLQDFFYNTSLGTQRRVLKLSNVTKVTTTSAKLPTKLGVALNPEMFTNLPYNILYPKKTHIQPGEPLGHQWCEKNSTTLRLRVNHLFEKKNTHKPGRSQLPMSPRFWTNGARFPRWPAPAMWA